MSSTDTSADQPETQLQHDSTLLVDKSVSLSLGSDSLLIVGTQFLSSRMRKISLLICTADDRSVRKHGRRCCGLCRSSKQAPHCSPLQQPLKDHIRRRVYSVFIRLTVGALCREDKDYTSHLVVQCPRRRSEPLEPGHYLCATLDQVRCHRVRSPFSNHREREARN